MTSLLILAVLLLLIWAWAIWRRGASAAFMAEWNYVLLVGAVTCGVMAAGLWLRGA
jgi:hypothetical protein